MPQDSPTTLRCAWPGCSNNIWVEKNFEICGGHARQVLDGMMGEARQRIERTRGLGDQSAEIARLKSENTRLRTELYAPRPTTRNVPTDGTVYILRCGGFVKIGWTADLNNRMRDYQPDSVLMATMPGTRKDEHRLHKRFAHLRSHGREWYPIAPQITEYAAVIVREHGEPDAVSFAARPVTVPQPRPKAYVGGNYRGNGLIGNPGR